MKAQEFLNERYVEITGCNLIQFVKDVYNLSEVKGIGIVNKGTPPLSTRDSGNLIRVNTEKPVVMEVVNGKACYMTVYMSVDNRLFIQNSWFDHSPEDLKMLLNRIKEQN